MATIADLSSNNGKVDWDKVKVSPMPKGYGVIEGVYLKANEGLGSGYIDSTTLYNATQAKLHGIKVGYYHFATLNTSDVINDATNEANFFNEVMKKFPQYDLPPVLDLETNKAELGRDQIALWIVTFFTRLKALGHNDYVLYSYTPFLESNLPLGHKFGGIKLWLAQYSNTEYPRVPRGWVKEWLWQKTSKATINGILTNVDLSITR